MYCVEMIAKAIAPILSHTAEDIWQYLPYTVSYKSVFQAGWLFNPQEWEQSELATKWEQLRMVRNEVNKVLEIARNDKAIGAPLEAKVLLSIKEGVLSSNLESLGEELRFLFITSQAQLVQEIPSGLKYVEETTIELNKLLSTKLAIAVTNADGQKCPRCWNYSTHIGESEAHPLLCDRCVDALDI